MLIFEMNVRHDPCYILGVYCVDLVYLVLSFFSYDGFIVYLLWLRIECDKAMVRYRLFLVVIQIAVSVCDRLWVWIGETFWFGDQRLFQDHTTFFVSENERQKR